MPRRLGTPTLQSTRLLQRATHDEGVARDPWSMQVPAITCIMYSERVALLPLYKLGPCCLDCERATKCMHSTGAANLATAG